MYHCSYPSLCSSRSGSGLASRSTSLGVDAANRAIDSNNRLGRSLGRGLSVRVDVEGDEEEEVRGQQTTAVNSSKLLAGTRAHVGHPGPVGRGEVGVRGKVDKSKIDNELDDLEPGDPLLPPHSDTSRSQEVVEVHDNVDKQVKGDGDPRDRGLTNELGVAQKSSGTMVVGVEESQLLLSQHKENGVDQLKVLGQVVEVVAEDNGLSPRSVVADGVEDTLSDNDGEELLNEEEEEHTGQKGEEDVVDLEEPVESDGRQVSHHLSAAKDDNVVHNDGNDHGRGRGKGDVGVISHENERGRGPAEKLLPGLVKDGPEVDTKGSVHGGDVEFNRDGA